jgi:hypothetical protein
MTELSYLAEEEITLPCALAAWALVGPTWKCLPERALNGPCGREVVGLARRFWSKSGGTIPFLFLFCFFSYFNSQNQIQISTTIKSLL